jgi:FeS assembly SUF system protein
MFSLFGKRKKEEPAPAPEPKADAAPTPVATIPSPWGPESDDSADDRDPWASSSSGSAATGTDGTAGSTGVANPGGLNLDALLAPPPAEATSSQPQIGPPDEARTEALKPAIVEALSTIYDPEIPVNIYELGLIYDVNVDAENRVGVRMTLTSPACPSAQQLPSEARYKVKAVEGVADCAVDIVWDPPWTKEMMSETAKLTLGIF